MSKKVQPAKKAWRSFSNTLQSKVHIPKSIKATLKRLLFTLPTLCLKPTGGHRFPTTPRLYGASNYHHDRDNNFSAVHMQDLFAEPASSVHAHGNTTHARGETDIRKEVIGNNDVEDDESRIDTIEDAWRVVVAKSPELRVDEMAEEFISKFREEMRQEMRLQKERSLMEFQEMLARGI
ncbi:hypothetical protein RIF29_21605 [Crotalaria pallida]|uniref:Uncharacterized protein n=1 Tax=Crotalaria pallida TaxID=3830 RepID=A0AAN9F4V5_CROPI